MIGMGKDYPTEKPLLSAPSPKCPHPYMALGTHYANSNRGSRDPTWLANATRVVNNKVSAYQGG